jgi:hypothetical protein
MIKTKYSKDNKFRYHSINCENCGVEMLRTIENNGSAYHCPTIIIHCRECKTKHYLKYDFYGIFLEVIDSFQKKVFGNY